MTEPEEEEDAPVHVLVLANAERCLVEMGFSSSTVQRALTCVSQSVTAAVDYALQVEARNQAPTNPQLRRVGAEMPARVDALAEQMEKLSEPTLRRQRPRLPVDFVVPPPPLS